MKVSGRACASLFVLALIMVVAGPGASPASAADPLKRGCGLARLASEAKGKACSIARNRGPQTSAAKNLLGGGVGGAAQGVLGSGGRGVVGSAAQGVLGSSAQGVLGSATGAATAVALGAVIASVLGGARFALTETAVLLGSTSSPQLASTWFSSAYWRVAGISAMLTLPFLFAAAVQALLRSDLALLVRAAFGYLPLAMLAVGIATPMTMLLLAASDQLSAVVASATGNASNRFINLSVGALGLLTTATGPFMTLFLGVFVVAGALVLWTELLMREAAVYVIVLMLPLAFAGMVWPARRVWAIRAVELLAALVLSKFAIVAVLSLGGAALTSGTSPAAHSFTAALAGAVLLIMGAFTPWALLRLLPLAEVASSAAGSLAREARGRAHGGADLAGLVAHSAPDWAADITARMRRDALDTTPGPPAEGSVPNGQLAMPQGGRGVASQGACEAPQPEADKEPTTPREPTTPSEAAADDKDDDEVSYKVFDVGIDEMHKPENRGRFQP